uniref:Uncharacterized protein n=1 Tax=Anguilla anguilla TaxID=7936 RepID=A0A0E9SHP0_ANGAN
MCFVLTRVVLLAIMQQKKSGKSGRVQMSFHSTVCAQLICGNGYHPYVTPSC